MMDGIKLITIVQQLVPGAKINLVGHTYEGLEWLDDRPKPTLEDIEAVEPDLELIQWRQTAEVDLYKLKIILDSMGDLEAVEGIIAQQPKGVQLAWENANTVRRNSPTVAGLAQVMEYSDEVLDQIFINAEQVEL